MNGFFFLQKMLFKSKIFIANHAHSMRDMSLLSCGTLLCKLIYMLEIFNVLKPTYIYLDVNSETIKGLGKLSYSWSEV